MARILIVDDSLMVRRLLAKMLDAGGHTVEGEAATGREAVAAYEEAQPDVVLLDLNMPAGDGFEALQRIREVDPESVIIVCSALARTRTTVVRALSAGAVDVLAKPFEPQRLLNAIESAIEGRDSRRGPEALEVPEAPEGPDSPEGPEAPDGTEAQGEARES